MRQKHDYGEGSIIEYRNFGDELVRVRVERREDDIKNGRPGFDGTGIGLAFGLRVWGYDDQITQVVKV